MVDEMTQQDDITQRLRDNADLDEAEHGNARVVQLEREAADEIERLRAELSKLRAPVADERALDLLDTLFTAYESGTPCYEEPDSQGGYLGMAFRIDDDTFRACADLLNKHRPRAALASAPVPVLKDWRIDTSAGGPILVYKDCSVIESAQAEYVLRLIAADQASAPVAAPSNETLRLAGVIADKIEDGTLFQAGIFSRRELADKVRAVVRFVSEASTPVAGEAQPTWDDLKSLAVKHSVWVPGYGPFAAELLATYGLAPAEQPHWLAAWLNAMNHAAPQASAEDVRNAALEEAIQAISRITTSYATFTSGNPLYRPESRPASAAIAEAIDTLLALKTQADKDGGQQREGVVTDDMRYAVRFAPSSAHWSERLVEFFGPDAREGIDALERQLREARAALSAPQAEQGERGA